jgi:vacuolar-type H+-ATPase subunit E/Vma4
MSLETILNTIAVSGKAELEWLRQETANQIQTIMEEAEQKAAARYETARQTILQPVAGERARRLHQAKLKALKIVGTARDEVAAMALSQARRHLIELRHQSTYPYFLRRLTEEAIKTLGEEELNGSRAPSSEPPEVEVDLRDEATLRQILRQIELDMTVSSTLNSWGGVKVSSGDGRVVVTNTLESRLERATPYLRQELAAFFMQGEG